MKNVAKTSKGAGPIAAGREGQPAAYAVPGEGATLPLPLYRPGRAGPALRGLMVAMYRAWRSIRTTTRRSHAPWHRASRWPPVRTGIGEPGPVDQRLPPPPQSADTPWAGHSPTLCFVDERSGRDLHRPTLRSQDTTSDAPSTPCGPPSRRFGLTTSFLNDDDNDDNDNNDNNYE